MTAMKRFLKDESGATAIEYGLIAAGISIAIMTIVFTIGTQLNTVFTNVNTQLGTAASSGGGGGGGGATAP